MPRQPAGSTTKESTKTCLIEAGIDIMMEKGYNNTGIQEILQRTGVPKGSFYYYFDSKEEFGLEIINAFDIGYTEKVSKYLNDKSLTPVDRLRKYCEDSRVNLENQQCRKGCLIGNLSQEMADQSEVMRARLEEVLTKWRNRFAQVIQEGQKAGEIPADIDHIQLAEFFLSGWEGSIMRSKTTKTTAPQQAFINVLFNYVFKCK
jgi:TetR/AcrR family transcriptional regulator, transcriptional repressor for nem operon